MGRSRQVRVHLVPQFVDPGQLAQATAVVIDVLRATTTIVYALAGGCRQVLPVAEVEEARRLADSLPAGKALLGGERGGLPVPGFDVGNSPAEYTPARCRDMTLVLTTTNGTRAIERAAAAERLLIAAFVNFSAVCEQLRRDPRPLHIVCAGSDGEVTLDDTLLAGALVDFLCEETDCELNDAARLAWDCFENHGQVLPAALELSKGGTQLAAIGLASDIKLAAEIDRFAIVPELKRDPPRLEVGAVGIVKRHWHK
ncbi:MAG: 2-phosphosulfolactate phosphatase [Gemmataceae bacterium]